MKKLLISLLCLSALPLIGYENPFSMEKDEDVVKNPLTYESCKLAMRNPYTFDKKEFALSTFMLASIYTLLASTGWAVADAYVTSKQPNKYWKDVATMYSNLWKQPRGMTKMLGSIGLCSAVIGATQSIKPKLDEKPVLINKPAVNK